MFKVGVYGVAHRRGKIRLGTESAPRFRLALDRLNDGFMLFQDVEALPILVQGEDRLLERSFAPKVE